MGNLFQFSAIPLEKYLNIIKIVIILLKPNLTNNRFVTLVARLQRRVIVIFQKFKCDKYHIYILFKSLFINILLIIIY